ncbi:microtubule-associated protein Jupiter-like isoform X1 [Centruroides vittatus]|uniref:microtubule-associated protein Jupiter-like isoform X1 n=1 Tax=Centruroides vittatus TaxID=120091 RepID=UPI003510C180
MAPILDFRHVETDNIGRGKRVLKPPGGECSDIFGSYSGPTQQNVKRGQQHQHSSSIFANEEPSSNNHNCTGRRDSDTQARLFGGAVEESSPRRVVDRMKSNIFIDEGHNNASPTNSAKKQVRRNPITGEVYDDEEEENGVNGHENENGDVVGNPITGEGTAVPQNPACVKIRNPPGGKSSGIF